MANLLRGGFWPSGNTIQTSIRKYEVASSYGTAIFPGDVVTYVTAGTVEALGAGGSDARLIIGVVAATSYAGPGNIRVENYIPATTVYSPTTRGSVNASYVWVFTDPDILFEVCVANHVNTDTDAKIYAAIGSNMNLLANAGDTIFGCSNYTLDGNPIAGSAQFRIEDIARDPANVIVGTAGTTQNQYWRALVRINEGQTPARSPAGI